MALQGKVCIVTGATRGIGKGIALQLAEAGATVYITGRTLKRGPKNKLGVGGSLEETAEEIKARGGTCIPVQCDHSKDEDIESLFNKVKIDQNGRLDILVNNAYAGVTSIMENYNKPFWEQEPQNWDIINNVGLRNHYFCGVYAARLMVPRKTGLIVNISSPGGLQYLFNIPYGVGKAACDRMAADFAHELRCHNVAAISLWPGAVQTENLLAATTPTDSMVTLASATDKKLAESVKHGETVEFAGKAIVHLAADQNVMNKSGRILLTGELGEEYGFTDIDGRKPPSFRSLKITMAWLGYRRTAAWVPSSIKIPYWMLAIHSSKF